MRNINANHFRYTHWLKLESDNELKKWQNLKEFRDKYDCSMTVYYYDYNPLLDKVIKLDCNQSYQELDLDVNSLSLGSLRRVKSKPTNITAYNKDINYFFKSKLGIEVKEKPLFPDLNMKDLVEVDVLSEFKNLENIEFFAKILKKEKWKVVKLKSDKVYRYQLYFGKNKRVGNRTEFAFSEFMYKSRMEDRLQRFINNYKQYNEFDISRFIGKKLNALEDIYQFSSGEKVRTKVRCIGIVLGITNNKVDIYDVKNPRGYQNYSVSIKDFTKFAKEGSYKPNYNAFSNLEWMEFRKYELKKLNEFARLCGDWDYRQNIDMTKAHLQSIEIDSDSISVLCEKFSPELDDYVSCAGDIIKDKNLVKDFRLLDITNREEVLNLISKIENHIDFKTIEDKLYEEEQKSLNNLKKNQEEELDYEK